MKRYICLIVVFFLLAIYCQDSGEYIEGYGEDVDKEEEDVLGEIKELFSKHKLQIKTCYGSNYNFK